MNITDQDIEAAENYLAAQRLSVKHNARPLIRAFAAHRLRGYNAGLEAAAQACDAVQRRMIEDPDFGAGIAAKAIRAMIEGEAE